MIKTSPEPPLVLSTREKLEVQALEDRVALHASFHELRSHVASARERLKPTRYAREHIGTGAVVASVVGILSGFGLAGIFTRK